MLFPGIRRLSSMLVGLSAYMNGFAPVHKANHTLNPQRGQGSTLHKLYGFGLRVKPATCKPKARHLPEAPDMDLSTPLSPKLSQAAKPENPKPQIPRALKALADRG